MAYGNKPVCGAKTRQEDSAEHCGLPAGWGTDHAGIGHCKLHGGKTAGQKVQAHRIRADRELRTVLAELDVEPVDDPLQALLNLGGQVLAWQEAAATLVNRLNDQIRYEGTTGAEQLRAEVALYERAMDRAAHVLGLIAKLNIEERMVAVSERQADRVIAAIDAALAHAGITGTAAVSAKQVAARHLRAI